MEEGCRRSSPSRSRSPRRSPSPSRMIRIPSARSRTRTSKTCRASSGGSPRAPVRTTRRSTRIGSVSRQRHSIWLPT